MKGVWFSHFIFRYFQKTGCVSFSLFVVSTANNSIIIDKYLLKMISTFLNNNITEYCKIASQYCTIRDNIMIGAHRIHITPVCSCINLEVCIHTYRCIINMSNVISIPDTPTSATRRSGCEDAFSANFLNSSSFSPYAYCLSNLTRTALCFPMTCLRKKL